MKYLVLILIFILQCSPVSAADNILKADFRHRPPEMIVDGNNISGVLKDIIEEAAEEIGYRVEWRVAPFSESLEGLKAGKVDIVPRTIRNKEREAFVNYLGPISVQRKDIVFLVHKGKGETVQSYEDLNTLRIGAKPKTSYFSKFDNDSDLNKVLIDTDESLARLFTDNNVDAIAVLDPEPLERVLSKLDFKDYTYAEYRYAQSIANYYGMSRSSQHDGIFNLLQENLLEMKTSGRIDELYKKHGITKELSSQNPFNLTLAERNWLESHPGPFKVHNELSWPPFNFNENGQPKGFAIDLINIIAGKLGIPIEYISGPNWSEFLEMSRNGSIDIMLNIAFTQDRQEYLEFTEPYITNPVVIVSRKGGPQFKNISELDGKTVAVPKGFFFEELIRRNYPEINLLLVKNQRETLDVLETGNADATIGSFAALNYLISNQLISPFQVSGVIPNELMSGDLRLGVRKEWSPLRDILQKVLDTVTREEFSELRRKWFGETAFDSLRISQEKKDRVETFIEPSIDIQWSDSELNWLKEHPQVSIAIMDAWPPMNYIDEDGTPNGIGVDYINAINKRLNGVLNIVPMSFKESYELVKSGKLDALMDITPKKEREPFFNFTQTYLDIPHVIVAPKDGPYYSSEADLDGKTIALEKGFYNVKYFRENYSSVKIKEYADTSLALDAVVRGQSDAYAGNRAVAAWIMQQELISGLEFQGRLNKSGSVLSIGVRKDWVELTGILDKALDSLTEEEKQQIGRKWTGLDERDTEAIQVDLTSEEQAWLKEHPVIKVHNETNWAPFNFYKNDNPMGFSIDYMNLLAEKLGFQIKYVTGPTWDEFMVKVKEKELDVMLNIVKSGDREKFLHFTGPYIEFAQALFTREGTPQISSVKDLYGKKFALQKGFYTEELLKGHPQVEMVFVKDVKAAILAVSTGRADAMLDVMPVVDYNMRQLFITNLKPGGQLGLDEGKPFPLSIGVRKDWETFKNILNKGMSYIAEDEINDLRNRWLGFSYEPEKEEVLLTSEENNWIKKHPKIRVNGDEWPPFVIRNIDGEYSGISLDILKEVAGMVGLEIEIIPGGWIKMLEMLKNHELDLAHDIIKTQEREKYLHFTEPYLDTPNAIYVRDENEDIKDINDLKGKTVPVVDGFYLEEVLADNYPEIRQITVPSTLEGLKRVVAGEADAYIGALAVSQHMIQKNLIGDLKIVGYYDQFPLSLRFGVRDDYKILADIMEKALAAISELDKQNIIERYVSFAEAQPLESEIEIQETAPTDEGISIGRLIVYIITVFLVLSLLVWFLLRIVKKEDIAFSFGSRLFRIFVLIGLSVFIIIVSVLGWFILERNKKEILKGVGENLEIIVNTANDRLALWVEQRKSFMKLYGRNPELVEITKCLLSVPPNRDDLLTSGLLCNARTFFSSSEEIFSNIGFFIISPDHISLASMRDTNVGTRNLISIQRPDLLERAFRGEVLFVPPIQSDVDLRKASQSGKDTRQYTKFFLAPIQDVKGDIISVFTLRIDPLQDFSKALQTYGMLKSGETYAFNQYGRMISESRFIDQLRQIGLLEEEQHSGMNIDIRDPGGNMVDGFRSETESSNLPFTNMVSSALKLKSDMDKMGQDTGFSDTEISTKAYRDYRGVEVFGAWLWSKDLGMGIASEIDAEEALESFYSTRTTVFGVLGFTLILSVGAILFVMILGERASKALIKARDTLEEKVEERTSELKEKQEQLAEAEEQSRLLLNSAGEGIFGVDTEGHVNFINPSATEMLGFSEEELLGQKVHRLIHHTHADGSLYPVEDCYMYKAYTEGTSHHVEDEMLWRKDGSGFHVEYASTPLLKGGELVGAVITFRDITERKAAAERFSALLESAPDGMIVSDDTGNIVLVNSQTEKLFGYPREELLGQKIDMLVPEEIREVHPDYRAGFYADPNRIAMGTGLNFYGISRDGQKIPVDISLSPIETDEGLLVVASIRDITERKKAEEELKESEKRYLSLFDDSPVSLWEEDWSGIKEYFEELKNEGISDFRSYFEENPYEVNHCARMIKILNVNKITLKMHEAENTDDLIKNLGKIFTEDTTEILREELIALSEGRTSFEGETVHRTLSGMELNISLQLNVIPGFESSLDKILISMIDITERIKTEREVKAKYDELERFRRMAVGRENKMIELKKEINELLIQSGGNEKYKIVK